MVNTLWRWLRLLLAVIAALVVSGIVWVGWLLSGQRYQEILTDQLSALFGARVQVEKSQLSFHGGFGVEFDGVTVKDDASSAPFFAAEEIDLLLDFGALWRGELLFHRIDLVKPHLQVAAEGKRLLKLVNRLREPPEAVGVSLHWLTGSAPRLAVQELRLYQADIAYAKTMVGPPLLFADTEAVLNFQVQDKPAVTLRTVLKHKNSDIGRLALRANALKEINFEALGQSEWAGEVELAGVQIQPLGHALDEEWAAAKVDLSGRFQGKGEGPVELTGLVTATAARVGDVAIHDVRLRLTKMRWTGQATTSLARALVIEAGIERLRGETGKTAMPITAQGGALTFRDDELSAAQLSGAYGTSSTFTESSIMLRKFSAKGGPEIDARVVTEVALEDDLFRVLTTFTPMAADSFSQTIAQPQGRAAARLRLQRSAPRNDLVYEGVVTLQQAGMRVVPWRLELAEVNGSFQVKTDAVSTEAVTFKIGQSKGEARGSVRDFLSARRSADLQIAFSDARDFDIAPLLPTGKMQPQGGTLSGHLKLTLPTTGEGSDLNGEIALKRIRLDLLDFLHPLEVVEGELTVAGHGGSFVVKRGQFPGGAFSGRGRIERWTPLRLEVSGDFPNLNLESALALDKSDDGLPKDATREVRAQLSSNRLIYKGSQMDDVRLSCYWHGRQAELQLERARIAGGEMQGEIILWPDVHSAYLAPHLTKVDVERFFHMVRVSTTALTGTLSSEGKIYMPNWTQWDELAQWDAILSLSVEDGVAQRLPVLIRLWSVLSMQGLLRLQLPSLPTEGLPFSSLTGDFALGKGVAVTNNLSLSGNSVRIEARGQIDLERRTLDLKTSFVPLHGLTSSVAKVPLAGELLARGADYLTTLNFRVSGPYADPSVTPLLVDTGE